jgi:hypothetical protein
MGRWMTVVRLTPSGAEGDTICEAGPQPLMWGAYALPKRVRAEFPMLVQVRIESEAYIDELQVLSPEESGLLLAELRRLRRICSRTEFVTHVDGHGVFDAWRTWGSDGEAYEPDDFHSWLDRIEHALERARDERLLVRLML